VTNGTIASNTGAGGNNGVINQGGTATLRNTIVAYNSTGSPTSVGCFGPITSGGYNLSPDTTCATGGPGDLTSVDPLLDPLGNNGGPTETRRPRAGSPAIA